MNRRTFVGFGVLPLLIASGMGGQTTEGLHLKYLGDFTVGKEVVTFNPLTKIRNKFVMTIIGQHYYEVKRCTKKTYFDDNVCFTLTADVDKIDDYAEAIFHNLS